MPKKSSQYVCQQCSASFPKWAGRCESCGEWNTLVEQITAQGLAKSQKSGHKLQSKKISEIKPLKSSQRITTGIKDSDVVFGGGIVPGSVSLIAGEPGIGKSTLILQWALAVSKKYKALYVSGEESSEQVRMRSERIDRDNTTLQVASSTSVDDICATIASDNLDLVIIDSIQTMATAEISSATGSVSQITNSTQLLLNAAKSSNTALLIVGHVTKQGNIAGPKLLEHLVDVVLNLEGDRYGGFKMLRAIKNRYGSTNESAIFEMKNDGMSTISNPSAALLAERQPGDGSVVLSTIEGSRAILVEIQALVNSTSFGYPKRAASGFDLNRLNLLIAMLNRRTKLKLDDKDVYLNVVGGLHLDDAAADLAVCTAIATAAKGMQLQQDYVIFGEVGLNGEIRHAQFAEKRIKEAEKMGFSGVIVPKSTKYTSKSFIHGVNNIQFMLNGYLKS
jgi:DNA repair protein RadA/Sms